MGSFNTTCFVSNQTIASGDKCRVMPIIQQATYSPASLTRGEKQEEAYGVSHSTCYSTAFWKPVSAFIPAKYDDYGRVELLFDPLVRANLFSFFWEVLQGCPIVAQGENTSHDHPFDFAKFVEEKAPRMAVRFAQKKADKTPFSTPDELDAELTACWDYVFEVASEHRLFMRNYQGIVRPLQFSIMHEEAYQALVAGAAKHTNWDGVSLNQLVYLQHVVKQAHAQAAEYAAEENSKNMQSFWFADALRSGFSCFTREGGYTSAVESRRLHELAKQSAAGELTDEQLVDKLLPFLNDKYVFSGLEEFNLKLSPMIYASQDYQNEIGSAYAKFVTEISQKVTRGRKVHYYGEYLDYQIEVSGQAQLDELIDIVNNSDSHVDAVDIVNKAISEDSENSVWLVKFSCSLYPEDLKEVLESLPNSSSMVQSLAPCEKM